MTRTRLLGRHERGGERSTNTAREDGPPRREEGWVPEERGQQVLEGLLQRGDRGNWRGCEGRSALVRSVCTARDDAGGDLGPPDSGLNLG